MTNEVLSNHFDIIPYAENLLNSNTSSKNTKEYDFLTDYINKNIGKWMKVEHLIGNDLVSHIGQLIASGNDYIVLKLEGNVVATVICNIKDICFITVIYSKNTNLLK